MRTPRQKQIKRLIKSLQLTGFRTPFNILADHEFLLSYNKAQLSLSYLEKILNGTIRLFITQCEYNRFKLKCNEKKLIGHVALKKCNHVDFRQQECLNEAILDKNPDHFFLASKCKRISEEKKIPRIYMRAGVVCVEMNAEEVKKIKKAEPPGLTQQEKERLDKMFME
ncbi:hypothetical protein NERG_01122 [Nematocida ausubeli]|uniref:Uncharacterized protein n=1 Tax=Nematocida ausubeli (strain ATCC PRA-371 / ERTm2) TaxID=1913371 RepID=H8ZCX5_NEMA1|nr:hypothetical protein NERG_01122 [Nematocida ausubeli]